MMNSLLFAIALPLFFIIHNIEECVNFDYTVPTLFRLIGGYFYTRMIFIYAVSILSLTVLIISVVNYYVMGELIHALAVIMTFSILINGLQHVVASIWERKMLAGTWSSLLLTVPFCATVLYQERDDVLQSVHHTLTFLLISVIVMIVSIFVSFLMGFGVDWCVRRCHPEGA
ncbi:MAG: HXXEE domain-containing protein [Gammaproteobacteria bacterium]|nr:HXXEE domain-containing protein [Gammaproteobacteria bacterium]